MIEADGGCDQEHAGGHRIGAQRRQAAGCQRRGGITGGGGENRQLRRHMAADPGERRRADEHDDAQDAQPDAQGLAGCERLVRHAEMGDHHDHQRHHRHEDGREAAGDLKLAPTDQGEGREIADDPHEGETRPDGAPPRQHQAPQPHHQEQRQAADRDPEGGDPERRQTWRRQA